MNNTFYDVLNNAADKWPDKPALIFDYPKNEITYSELKKLTEKMALVLKSYDIKKGDKVAVMLPNILEFPVSWLGLGLIGGVIVPLNTRYQKFDAAYLLEHSEAKLIITESEYMPMLRSIQKENDLDYQIITVDSDMEIANGYLPDLLAEEKGEFTKEAIYEEDLINIQYTSGTTGKPKGCMLTQKYWINIGKKIANPKLINIDETDRLLTSQPFYYMDPQWNTMASLVNGSTLIILDRFSPSVFWEKVRSYKTTFLYCLGNMPALLLKMPIDENEKDHNLKFVGCSAIPNAFHQELEDRFNVRWHEVFGMTETGYDISMRTEDHENYIGTDAIGKPAIDREVRIMDSSSNFLPRGEKGEIVLRGQAMMDGYYKNLEATKTVFDQGWFRTGDLGRIDTSGVIFYEGRIKDMIRRSGENISASEVEEVILQSPLVTLAACVPAPDDLRGEEVKVFLKVKDTDYEDTIEQLIFHTRQNLASFKVPRYWVIIDEFPLTPSERIAKHQLNELNEIKSYDLVTDTWLK